MDRASHQATTEKGEFILRERRNAIPGPHFKCFRESHNVLIIEMVFFTYLLRCGAHSDHIVYTMVRG